MNLILFISVLAVSFVVVRIGAVAFQLTVPVALLLHLNRFYNQRG